MVVFSFIRTFAVMKTKNENLLATPSQEEAFREKVHHEAWFDTSLR